MTPRLLRLFATPPLQARTRFALLLALMVLVAGCAGESCITGAN